MDKMDEPISDSSISGQIITAAHVAPLRCTIPLWCKS